MTRIGEEPRFAIPHSFAPGARKVPPFHLPVPSMARRPASAESSAIIQVARVLVVGRIVPPGAIVLRLTRVCAVVNTGYSVTPEKNFFDRADGAGQSSGLSARDGSHR